ncbi:MAG: Glucose-6-phosphate isomerase [Lentisphaerae bacterium ADurb.BinA184]|nr:MAG: Glucose-6-phosphate isomerase [Lentisphaerae bacterium ADurb.BinA184]
MANGTDSDRLCFRDERMGFTLDLSGMGIPPEQLAALDAPAAPGQESPLARVRRGMRDIEAGKIKNPDEGRQVTHFTDRLTYLESPLYAKVQGFAEEVRHDAAIDAVIVNGIGGSALGPQLVQFAARGPYWNEGSARRRQGWPRIYFLDNTDSAGLADVAAAVNWRKTLVVTISKSGKTQETKNNMVALEQAYAARGLEFARHAVAVTMADRRSDLFTYASDKGWRQIFPMAESIGGRTSETNIVGHVPAALTGIDFAALVNGARHMDGLTRRDALFGNPAYLLAAAWYIAGDGRGDRNMVVVPYSDRLVLLAKYLQQLVMESLGKALDLDGRPVHQGLTVYGNKGGTDAHAYIQQLNDGRDDFFVTFVEPLRDAACVEVGDGMTLGDYLHAFKEGLASALAGRRRRVMDIVVESVCEESLGMLIALYERAVAAYAELINVNAFHQPGVQAYKEASHAVNQVSRRLQAWLRELRAPVEGRAGELAAAAGLAESAKAVDGVLAKFAVNGRRFGASAVTRRWDGDCWQYRAGKPTAGRTRHPRA